MTSKSLFAHIRSGLSRTPCSKLILASALVCSMAVFTLPADAQTEQHLPDSLVNQQTPPSFPQDDASGQTANAAAQGPATPQVQQTPPVGKTPSVPQTNAPAATVSETPNGDQTAAAPQAQGPAVSGQAATTPAPGDIPPQPEAQKLSPVPATPMGSAAQNAETGQNQAAAEAQGAVTGSSLNPVEDAAPQADADAAASTGLPDPLAKYSAAAQGAPEGQDGDALPDVDNTNMVKLQGDFPNAATNSVSVPLGGAEAQGGKSKEQLQEEIRTEAFDAAITGMFPLSPDQVQTLLKRYDNTQKVASAPPYDAPKPEISVQNISLDPGIVPPTIKTAVGNVTTINMLDATGAPWPVQDVTWAGDFEVVEPEEGGHIVRITPMAQFAHGNIVIRLLTLKTPLTLTLETSRDVVQYRVDARIPEYGPFANAPLMQGAKSTLVAGSPDLTSLLDGVMPGGMQKLTVSGVDGRTTAYSMNGTTYIRTPLTLLSPAWQSSVSSADGMNVYALSDTPVLLLSDGGEFMRATLKEKEDLLDE